MTAFFISYTAVDQPWAEWIASVLEAAGNTTKIQAWDFRPGQNFVIEMHRAAAGSDRTIAVLSPDYLRSLYATAEWAAAFVADPDGTMGKLVPVLVRETDLDGLLRSIIYIRLVGLPESAARERLLSGLVPGRVRPESVRFPGAHSFPGAAPPPRDPEAGQNLLATLPLDEVPQPGPLPVGSRMPLAANPLFVGREEDLKLLARQLKTHETSAVGQVAAASGLGGIGKTQLASEFVHRYGRFFEGGAFWMSFADAGSVPIEVAASGASLGLHSSFENLTLEQQVRLVEEAWKSPLPRLLVFDNCEEEDLLRRWRPSFGGCRVLVTSRRSDWNPVLGVFTIQLTTLARPASLELLRRFRPDLPNEEPVLNEIAAELGDLPLALHLAGSFLRAYRNSAYGNPAAYLESLRKTDLLAHPSLEGRGSGGLLPTGHDAHVGRTFALSFDRLEPASTTDALAATLLARAAWFAPGEPIPRSLLLKTFQVRSGDLTAELDAEDALRRLIDLGLVETNERNDLLMHRLVAAWARGIGGGDEARRAVEDAILAEATQLNEKANPALLLAWEPHFRVVTDQALTREDQMAARLGDELGLHLWYAGNYSEGRLYLEKAVALHEQISGPEHSDTATSLNILGRHLHSQGDYPRARLCYEKSLKIREKIWGPEHPDTAHSLNDLGALLYDQGDFREVHRYYERALTIRDKVLGSEHPTTALSIRNLGGLLHNQGDLTGARLHYERSLMIREKVLGLEHPDTANSLLCLGALLQDQGDLGGAQTFYERSLATHEKVLGPEHPSTATSLNLLGGLLQAKGDFIAARAFYEQALKIRERALGPEHPDTAACLNNLGSLLKDQGDLTGARRYYERSLALLEKALGPDHPNIAFGLNNIGGLFKTQGNLKDARLYGERALAIQKKALGAEHPDVERSLFNLGILWFDLRNFGKARGYLNQAMGIFKTRLGEDHPDTQEARWRFSRLPGGRQIRKRPGKKK
jgi:tetratricopeptide (TPR) repeat protein